MLKKKSKIIGKKLKLTVDTNVLISAFITSGNENILLKLGEKRELIIFISPYIMMEFIRVTSRPKFGLTLNEIETEVKRVLNSTKMMLPNFKLNVVKEDPSDNRILECAVAVKADYLISGDKHLLNFNKYKDIDIINGSEFLRRLNL